ncbi:hypothetical protein Tco_0823109 [Tanacetum coccineum]|uniref:MAK10-like protein n=1 Tax=Tanacetum coccineum TaxID=301880 RepID=A0ABQ5AGY5_9ASTR
MGDVNPIRTLEDYSKPSHEGYRNTIELPVGNNVVPLRSDTIRLVQNGCSFHELRYEDPNQHLKDFLKFMDSLDLDGENRERTLVLEWEEKIKLQEEKEMKFDRWRNKNFKNERHAPVKVKDGMDDEGEVTLYLMRRSLEILRKFHWMILGGRFNQLSHVSSPLLSKPGEY